MEIIFFSETLASTDEPARRPNPEEHHHRPHRREDLKFHIFLPFFYMDVKFCVSP
jgi:hypothetical protein